MASSATTLNSLDDAVSISKSWWFMIKAFHPLPSTFLCLQGLATYSFLFVRFFIKSHIGTSHKKGARGYYKLLFKKRGCPAWETQSLKWAKLLYVCKTMDSCLEAFKITK